MTQRQKLIFISVAAAAFLLKAVLAWCTYGTNDVMMFQDSLAALREHGGLRLYRARVPLVYGGEWYGAEVFNHPPLVIGLLQFWGAIADWTRVPFGTMLRLTSSLADLGMVLLVYRLSVRLPGLGISPFALIALAACPVSIFVAGFHGNTDPIMIFLVLLSLYFLEVRDSAVLCGMALGLAMEIKIVPVILIPTLLLYLGSWRKRVTCIVSMACAASGPALYYLYLDAPAVIGHVVGYNSTFGYWGITWITSHTPFAYTYNHYGKLVIVVLLLGISLWLNFPRRRAALFDQWGIVFFVFLLFAPGFSIQYLDWLVPWVATLGTNVVIMQYTLNGGFVFMVYTFWCRGLPWYFANSSAVGMWNGPLDLFQCVAWASLGPALGAYRLRLNSKDR